MQIDIDQLIDMRNVIDFINKVTKDGLPISINDEIAIKSIIATAIITGIVTLIVTTVGTFIATYYATKATSRNTISLFKEQEKFKKKDDLRLKFFDEYEMRYNDLYESLGRFMIERRYGAGLLSSDEDENVKFYFDSIKTVEDVISDYKSDEVKKLKELAQELLGRLEDLKGFMKSKEIITGYEKFKYEKELNVVRSINDKLGHLRMRFNMCDLIKIKEEESGEFNEEDAEKNVSKYREILINIHTDQSISDLEESIEKVDKEIRNEFIGCYFTDEDNKK